MAPHTRVVFTPERQEKFLTLLETGRNVKEACEIVDVSRNTVANTCKRDSDFAQRYAVARREPLDDPRLSKDDVLRLMEKAAIKGSVVAQKLLLERFEKAAAAEKAKKPGQTAENTSVMDELASRRAKTG